ncbi:MAG: right-handed parallel beta-helix repeat-containing protein [Polyangiaceae bacterium]
MADWWDHVVAATSPVDGSISKTAAPASIDGVPGATITFGNKRILLKHQSTAADNTTWQYNGFGNALTATTDTPAPRATVRVDQGTVNAKTEWSLVDTTSYSWATQSLQVNVRDFGATGNGQTVTDGAMTSGSGTLTCSTSAPFKSTDVGKTIVVSEAGTPTGSHGVTDLTTTISAFTNASTVTLTASAGASVTGATVTFGSDDSTAVQAAVSAVLGATYGGSVFFPVGTYVLSGEIAITTVSPQRLRVYGEGRASALAFAGVDTGLSASTTYNIEVEDLRFIGSVGMAVSLAMGGPCWVRRCYFDDCCTRTPSSGAVAGVILGGISDGWVRDCEFIGNGIRSAILGPAVETGSSPAVTLTGAPSPANGGIVLQIATGGVLGTATFEWSYLGATLSAPLTTGASVGLGSSGVTAGFASGTYTAGDSWTAVFYGVSDAYSVTSNASGGVSSRLHVLGNRIAPTWAYYGVALYDTDYSEISGNSIDMGGALNRGISGSGGNDHSGYGILFYSTTMTPKSFNSVTNNTVSNAAGMGIYLQNNTNCAVTGNVLDNVAINQPAVSLDPAGITCDAGSGSVVGNLIATSGSYGIATVGGSFTISGNRIDGCASAGIFIDAITGNAAEFIAVTGNQISNSEFGMYSPNGSSKCALVGNVVSNSSHLAIQMNAAVDCTIIGNQIDTAGASQYGIYLDSSSARCVVTGNGLKNITSWAIASNAASTQILNNIVIGASGGASNGILSSGDYSTVRGNDVSNLSGGTALAISGTSPSVSANWTISGTLTGGPTITGARASTAETSLLSGLASSGLVVDSSTAPPADDFQQLSTAKTVTSTSYQTILTSSITTTGGSHLGIWFTCAGKTAVTSALFDITVDAGEVIVGQIPTASFGTVPFVVKVGVSAGSHTVLARAHVSTGGTLTIDPSLDHYATMLVQEMP